MLEGPLTATVRATIQLQRSKTLHPTYRRAHTNNTRDLIIRD